MLRRVGTLLAIVTLFLLSSACGLLQEPPTPSAPLEAIPLEEGDEEAATTEETAPTATPVPEVEATATPAEAEAADPTPTAVAPTEAPAAERRIYTISQTDSEVRFVLEEDLRGERTTVVGITDQVAGEIAFSLDDLSTAEVGVIQINARTLATDNNFRNRAIQNEILETGPYEFITFTPTAVNGLPAVAAPGEEVTFTVDGQLTIRDTTQPVTFDVVATPISEDELAGTATTTVSREAFGLRIPDVPSVANVDDAVELILEFVAFAQ